MYETDIPNSKYVISRCCYYVYRVSYFRFLIGNHIQNEFKGYIYGCRSDAGLGFFKVYGGF